MKDCHDGFLEARDDIPLKESGTDDILNYERKEYPSPAKLVPILVGLCFQSFCIALDNTILATAVPKITEQFNSLEDLSCLGGLLTDRVSWRWCFYINIPLGAITGLFIILFFKDAKSDKKREPDRWRKIKRMDPWGVAVFMPAIISILLGLQWGGTKYPWGDPRIIILFVLFGVFGSIWCVIQFWKQDEATVPPRLLKNRNVFGAVLHAMFLGGSFFVFGYYLPIWFQAIRGESAADSGINNLPMLVSMIVCSAFGGLLVNLLGYYTPLMYVGSALLTIGSGLCTTFQLDTSHAEWIGYQVIIGVGAGVGFQQCINALQTVLPLEDIPIGIAIITFAQSLSGALFISIAQNVFQNRLVANLTQKAPTVNPTAVIQSGAANLAQRFPKDILPGVLHGYNIAVTQTFYVSVATAAMSFLGAGFVEWKSMRREKKYSEDERDTE
ncbi:Major facilitator superfamily domain general substrate transporter [Penicillium argentinense]|uniref:Major facilitator superfamily domain general substrate transporter n=1 Tax=Penicillium argentinense TaxID=1131581 RepID=A0A9W9F7L2_9EURO|nr:Major facilitator superfamily domain general substrate transporter [Penicillium argentinense]KAJ5095006.1 Major facilitator superfamily domain general substrate transporter [Penicillium argentinense]